MNYNFLRLILGDVCHEKCPLPSVNSLVPSRGSTQMVTYTIFEEKTMHQIAYTKTSRNSILTTYVKFKKK